jgi:N-acetylneuraminate lyase
MNKILSGLVAAPHTPFRSNGELALDVIPRQAVLLAHNGVKGAFICGTTGEGYGMTVDERKQAAAAWRKAAPAALKLVVHVGHLSLDDSCALARHAGEIGADAIATIAPSFFKPASAVELVGWCSRVAAAAPKLPFYYYHMPAMTGVHIPAAEFLREADGKIPNLAGIKFTHEDLMDYANAGGFGGGRYSMLFGRDEILLAGLGLGADGAVGSTYNFAAPLYLRLIDAFARGDLETARREQARAREFIGVLHRHGGLAAGKTAMKFVGVDCGPVRLPLRAISADQEARMRAELQQIGFFEYCCKQP